MDEAYLLQGQRFVWNREKAANNLAKHGITFERACEAFFDPFLVLEDAGPDEEDRDVVLGMTEDWTLLFVVHVLREEDSIRIISARPATAKERRIYEDSE